MYLITMAHMGEALGLIDYFNLRKESATLYENEILSLCITGEGPFEAAISTSLVISSHSYKKVINLGIAGSLNSKLAVGEIYPVRSHYLVIEGVPQFKSFQGNAQGEDCLTSFSRILNADEAAPLRGLAGLVDREAWGVAMAAKKAALPFESHKLVSDSAGSLGACEIAREKSDEWSLKLANYLQQRLDLKSDALAEVSELEGFYFTFSSQHRFKNLLDKLKLKHNQTADEVLSSFGLTDLRSRSLTPKDRTKNLFRMMEKSLDPVKYAIEEKILSWQIPYRVQGVELTNDPQLEDKKLKVSFEVVSQNDLETKIDILKKIDLKPFHQIMEGDLHVE